jgi:hypothetical protein
VAGVGIQNWLGHKRNLTERGGDRG